MNLVTCEPLRNLRPPGKNCALRLMKAAKADFCLALRGNKFCWMEFLSAQPQQNAASRSFCLLPVSPVSTLDLHSISLSLHGLFALFQRATQSLLLLPSN